MKLGVNIVRCRVMRILIGDRFQHRDGGDQWEITEIYKDNEVEITCVLGTLNFKLGTILYYHTEFIRSVVWIYLGNFSKKDNFEELYDLLNED